MAGNAGVGRPEVGSPAACRLQAARCFPLQEWLLLPCHTVGNKMNAELPPFANSHFLILDAAENQNCVC